MLVDLPPDDLLARLDAGKVYVPVAIEHARQNFFRKGNLISLREISLRRVADRVDADVTSYRVSNCIETVWPTIVGSAPNSLCPSRTTFERSEIPLM